VSCCSTAFPAIHTACRGGVSLLALHLVCCQFRTRVLQQSSSPSSCRQACHLHGVPLRQLQCSSVLVRLICSTLHLGSIALKSWHVPASVRLMMAKVSSCS
jgi:hypothetical protein